MKAAVFLGPGRIEIKNIPDPKPKQGEVLLKVKACAICGTDVRIFYHGQKNVVPPRITGHEIAGIVEDIGSGVKNIKPGTPVTTVTSVGCGICKLCLKGWVNLCPQTRAIGYFWDGGFAEKMIIPKEAVAQNSLIELPNNMNFDVASLIEPFSCCINGQDYLNIQKGDTIVIFGSGPIGCMHIELAKAQGAGFVYLIDVSDERLNMSKSFGVDECINGTKTDPVKRIIELTQGQGADCVITACPANLAQEQALQMLAKKARVSFFGGLPKDNPYIKLDSNIIHYKEISVFGAFASHREQFVRALEFILSGKVNAENFITHRFSLEEITSAIDTVRTGKSLKAVIEI
jgi:L-iditol 2-dehydrogenase